MPPIDRYSRCFPTSALCLIGILLFAGCGSRSDESSTATAPSAFSGSYPINVVGTTGMVCDLVRIVGGDHVAVTQILGSGVDPHLYKPTSDDVKLILQADVVFYSGLLLEGKMSDSLTKVGRLKPVIAVTQLLDESTLLHPEGFEGHFDPHVWMDVSAWAGCVEVVREQLSKFDPTHASDYKSKATELQVQLTQLHQYGIDTLASIPENRRILITSHDAFNYFGRAYGLQVLGVQGISTESEAGIQRINKLVDLLVENNVQAVFTESSVPQKSIDALIEGANSRGHQVSSGGELFSDAMGDQGTYEGTYIGMLDHNITIVGKALGGETPPGGLHGKLSGKHSEPPTESEAAK